MGNAWSAYRAIALSVVGAIVAVWVAGAAAGTTEMRIWH
jgi:hypothetical protein